MSIEAAPTRDAGDGHVLHAAVRTVRVPGGQAGRQAAEVEVAADDDRAREGRDHGREEVAALGQGDEGVRGDQVGGAGDVAVGGRGAQPGASLRTDGILDRVRVAAAHPVDRPAHQQADAVRLPVAALDRAADASVDGGLERDGRARPDRARKGVDIASADLVERDHVRPLRGDHDRGFGDRTARIATGPAAVAQVHLQHVEGVRRPDVQRGEGQAGHQPEHGQIAVEAIRHHGSTRNPVRAASRMRRA